MHMEYDISRLAIILFKVVSAVDNYIPDQAKFNVLLINYVHVPTEPSV